MGCLVAVVALATVGCSADDVSTADTFAYACTADFAVASDWSVLLLL